MNVRSVADRPPDQAGQAVLESLLVLGVLASFWLAVAWVGRLQDVGLHLSHHSWQAAFAWAHQGVEPVVLRPGLAVADPLRASHWQQRDGQALLTAPVAITRDAVASPLRDQPGDPLVQARSMRRELHLGQDHLSLLRAHAQTEGLSQTQGRLHDFDRLALSLRRHTAILAGGGSVGNDQAAQSRLANSPLMWAQRAGVSQSHAQAVTQRLQGIDTAWGRVLPQWDWLSPWAERVPSDHLSSPEVP